MEELRVKLMWNKHSLVRLSEGGIPTHTVRKHDSGLLPKLVPKVVPIHGTKQNPVTWTMIQS